MQQRCGLPVFQHRLIGLGCSHYQLITGQVSYSKQFEGCPMPNTCLHKTIKTSLMDLANMVPQKCVMDEGGFDSSREERTYILPEIITVWNWTFPVRVFGIGQLPCIRF